LFGSISVHWFCSHYLLEVCFLIFVCLKCFLDVCIIDLGFQNFWTKKLQMVITFDKKLALRRSKNESFSKLHNEAPQPSPKGIQNFFFQNSIVYPIFFIFFCIFFIFLDFSLLFHLFILVKNFWKLLWFFFVCIGDLSKKFWKILKFFFSHFFLKTAL